MPRSSRLRGEPCTSTSIPGSRSCGSRPGVQRPASTGTTSTSRSATTSARRSPTSRRPGSSGATHGSRWCSRTGPSPRRTRTSGSRPSDAGEAPVHTGRSTTSAGRSRRRATSSWRCSTCQNARVSRSRSRSTRAATTSRAKLLEAHGWRVLDPATVTADPDSFHDYVQGSWAEFSVAKGAYVATSTGWFSERTARYLASGRPALVQDTGFSRTLPVGEGLIAFRTLEDAVAGAERIAADYERHRQAARMVAEEPLRLRPRAHALPRGRRRVSRALCVLGMMRTGTSAVAGLLDLLGAHFGPKDRLLEPNVANPSGFWEHKGVIAVNDELLARLGGSWHAPPAAGPGWHESPTFDDLRARAIELVAADLAAADVWAWKDPRTCLTLPFWDVVVASFLPVICVREPDATARSFSTMGWAAVDGLERPYETGLDLWLAYTTAAFEGTRGARAGGRVLRGSARRFGQPERAAGGLRRPLRAPHAGDTRRDPRIPPAAPLATRRGHRLPEPCQNTLHMRNTRGSKAPFGGRFQPRSGYTERRGEAFSRRSRGRCGRCGGRRPLGRCDDVARRVEATCTRRAAGDATPRASSRPRRPQPKRRRRTRRAPRR